MKIKDIRKMIRYPLWVNDDPFADRYETENELISGDMMECEVVYITTDGEGEMTIEIR